MTTETGSCDVPLDELLLLRPELAALDRAEHPGADEARTILRLAAEDAAVDRIGLSDAEEQAVAEALARLERKQGELPEGLRCLHELVYAR